MKNQKIEITSFYKTVKSFKKKISQKVMETYSIANNKNEKGNHMYHFEAGKQISKKKRETKFHHPQKQLSSIHHQIIHLKSKHQLDTTLGPDFKIYECDNFLVRTPVKKIQSSLNSSASYVNLWNSPAPPPLPPKYSFSKPPPLVMRKNISYC